ncbi:MAG TPA: HEAT repeat domain-containing protein [Gemmatimonadales bacterium]|nr:HEAT repeat domain-containing protein [Gemmatimonadales bacterium]
MTLLKLALCLAGVTSASAQTPEPYAQAEARAKWKVEEKQFKADRAFAYANPGKAYYLKDQFSLEEPAWKGQGSPEDSVYRGARELLNRGEYRRASEQFRSFEQKYPKSRYVPAAMYWQAFALYRVGATTDLRQALQVLDDQRSRYPDASQESEVSSLTTRVVGALASRGDSDASKRLRDQTAQGTTCDREDQEIRAEALSALVQSDPAGAAPVIRRTLARRDECSVPLRRRAVYLLGREGVGGTPEDLLAVAKDDPEPSVRADALGRLAQMPGDAPVKMLEQLLTPSADERTQRAVVNALRVSGSTEGTRVLRTVVEREDLSESARAEAVRSLSRRYDYVTVATPRTAPNRPTAYTVVTPRPKYDRMLSDSDVTALRAVYDKTSSRTVKNAILETIGASETAGGDQWLMSIVRNPNEETRYRQAAMSRLRRSDVSLDELGKLYDGLSERELRGEIIRIMGQREEPAATDKLLDIARTGTDPNLRRAAISALARKNDPRTTKLLLELVEK